MIIKKNVNKKSSNLVCYQRKKLILYNWSLKDNDIKLCFLKNEAEIQNLIVRII